MKYKEFVRWCSDRSADGCWGFKEASLCLFVLDAINSLPFWKREKAWKGEEEFLVNNVITPINKLIEKLRNI